MQELLELIRAINITRMKSSGLWYLIFENGSLSEKLCIAIYDGRVSNDEEAIALLYSDNSGKSKYLNLRERLKEKLQSMAFLLEFKSIGESDRKKAYDKCNRKYAAAMLLTSKGLKKSGIEMLEDVLKQSIFFDFTDLAINSLAPLRLYYGTIVGNMEQYKIYKDLYAKYQEVWIVENMAEDAYTDLVSNFVKSKASKPMLSEKALEYYLLLKPHLNKYDSFKLHLCGRLVETMVHSSRNDFKATALVCEKAIDFFTKKPFESYLPLQTFYYQLVVCHLQLKEFDKGYAAIQKCQPAFEAGTFNWLKLKELCFLLAMHTKHYDRAYAVCESVQKDLESAKQLTHIVEMWKIYEAYVQYLAQIGKVKTASAASKKFKLHKFLNEIPVFSKDKQGMNIPILIVQILFTLANRNFKNSMDRIEAIEKYCNRYLRQTDTFRSNCIIKALLQLPAANFHPEAVQRKAKKYIDLLQQHQVSDSFQNHEIEIIPYEDLWEMILDTIKITKPTTPNRMSATL